MAFQSYRIQLIKAYFKRVKFATLFEECKGQVFTIDLFLALIIITVVIGMSANAIDMASSKILDSSAGTYLDRIATDAADILINTPGSHDWEKSNSTILVTPGLTQDKDTGGTIKVLSYAKISKLKLEYNTLMGDVLPAGGSSSLTIYPVNSSLGPIQVGNKTPSASVTDVAVVNRTVLVNFRDYQVLTTVGSVSEICPHYNFTGVTPHYKPNYNNSTPGWNCMPFTVTREDMDADDIYILTDPNPPPDSQAIWMIDGPSNFATNDENFQTQPLLVNNRISTMMSGQDDITLWLHVFTSGDPSKSFNTYLVAVPKGTPSGDIRIEYLNHYPCFFVLKVWME